jgi:hypothetical protein
LTGKLALQAFELLDKLGQERETHRDGSYSHSALADFKEA